MEKFISFIVSIAGDVTAYYIIKWLNRIFSGNQPKD